MIVYQLGLKSKFRLMCEGGIIYIKPIATEAPYLESICDNLSVRGWFNT